MNVFSKYPYQNFSDYNLDWLLRTVKEVNEKLSEYLESSVITFADPITWDITEQYTALTCVVDSDGTAHLSKRPVPAGVDITNTNYWLPIFNYDDNINTLRSQIAYNARTSNTTGVALAVGDLVFWNGLIYKVTADMPSGTAFIIGENITKYTVDEKINSISSDLTADVNAFKAEINENLDNFETRINEDIAEFESDITNNITNISNTVNDNNDNIQEQIAARANDAGIISEPLNTGDLVFFNNTLYRLLTPLSAGAQIIPATNAEECTVDDKINIIKNIVAEKYYFTPEDYGALADGVHDDTQAIQDMFDAMPDYSCAIFTGREYLVTEPLYFRKNSCVLSGGYQGGTEYNTRINSRVTGNVDILTVTSLAFAMYNMTISGAGRGTHLGYVILFDNDNTTQDGNTDAFIVNCQIATAEKGIGVKGRNLVVKDSILSGLRYGIDWLQTNINTELRGHIIDGCRFHGIVCAVRNYISNILPTKGNTIQNNILDGGSTQLFSGTGGNISILNNTVYFIESISGGGNVIEMSADALNSSVHKNVIMNNIMHLNGKNYTGIFLNNVSAVVMNNYIEDITRRGIAAAGGANAFISHNTVSNSQSFAFQIESGSNGIICNNLAINCAYNTAGGTGSANNLAYNA